jgi:Universal stress protein family
LLVIGATGHSALYERIVGSRADRIMQLAQCPVLVVKCASSEPKGIREGDAAGIRVMAKFTLRAETK